MNTTKEAQMDPEAQDPEAQDPITGEDIAGTQDDEVSEP